ncbi:YkgJ family cysteine cluster protein [Pseudodesulfovibrio sediminis]|uniref:YkgJ family cysteine cluster protein n=1 Tax=Pseudodesulfovibrio sediminis TaxID=2810563 RepID=A0ABM7P6V7_9BACT|nr:YkgJ family cysteine cluster protein [Pseudodesulfovibrio sediminis]BCS88590.1 hypothetical protein PSDVSF_18320 [Pseudodesulfovibrio sediminis]
MCGNPYFTGLFRRFRAFVLRSKVQVRGRCKGCGYCCQDIMLKDKGRWLRTNRQFKALVKSNPEHARFTPVGRDEYGFMIFTCKKLGPDNLCSSYDDRPELCRNYPSDSLYYQGDCLQSACGYSFKDISFRDVLMRNRRSRIPKFSQVLRKEIEQDKKRTR